MNKETKNKIISWGFLLVLIAFVFSMVILNSNNYVEVIEKFKKGGDVLCRSHPSLPSEIYVHKDDWRLLSNQQNFVHKKTKKVVHVNNCF